MSDIVTMNVSVTPEIKQFLQELAQERDRPVSYVVRQIVLGYKACRERRQAEAESKEDSPKEDR